MRVGFLILLTICALVLYARKGQTLITDPQLNSGYAGVPANGTPVGCAPGQGFSWARNTNPTCIASATPGATSTPVPSSTPTFTATPTATFTPTATATVTATPTPVSCAPWTIGFVLYPNSAPSCVASPTPTATSTSSPSPAPTAQHAGVGSCTTSSGIYNWNLDAAPTCITPTPTQTATVTPTPTQTFTATPSPAPTAQHAGIGSCTIDNGNTTLNWNVDAPPTCITPTATQTATVSPTPTATATATFTATATPSPSPTPATLAFWQADFARNTGLANTTNTVNLTCISFPVKFNINHIVFYVSTTDATGGHLYDVGVYDIGGNLVADIGPTAMTTSGLNEIAPAQSTPVVINPGIYCMAVTGNSNVARWALDNTSGEVYAYSQSASTGTSVGGQLPNPLVLPTKTLNQNATAIWMAFD